MTTLSINGMNLGLAAWSIISLALIMTMEIVAVDRTIMSSQMAAAQSADNNTAATSLGNPFFVEKGRVIGQRVLSVNPLQVEFTVVANATINENINATNTGTTVSPFSPMEYFRPKDKDSL